MKYILIVLLSLNYFNSFGQNYSNNNSIDLSTGLFYGTNETSISDFNSNLQQQNHYLVNTYSFYSLSISPSYIVKSKSKKYKLDGEISVTIQQPYNYKDDNISINQSGFFVGVSPIGFDLFSDTNNIDIIIQAGINTGMNYLDVSGSNFNNFFFAPKLRCHLRYFLGKVALGLKLEAVYDFSNPTWNTSEKEPVTLSNLRNNGYLGSFSIGYKF